MACRLVQAGGDWVLDDTSWQRWAKTAEAVSFVWCGRLNQVVTGMQVVLLIWGALESADRVATVAHRRPIEDQLRA